MKLTDNTVHILQNPDLEKESKQVLNIDGIGKQLRVFQKGMFPFKGKYFCDFSNLRMQNLLMTGNPLINMKL